MSDAFQPTGDHELNQLIAKFIQAIENGESPDREQLKDQHPHLADQLQVFFDDHDQMPNMVDRAENPGAHSASQTSVPQIIGPYTLEQQLGSGGMGSVWLAKQVDPVKREVAVKLIKPGMDSRAVLARFDVERQALAMMEHPNIAKVFDAGATEKHQPYFVMELVRGNPITQYCDEQRLTPRERLDLFIPVCRAIQHAHQKGIIHRDIKPSNVLVAVVDGKPVPKVIDFGVAKATGEELTEKTLETKFGAIVGTPQYMSPEQAELNNLDIDTRSDVYSLGVLLYELLAGSPPFHKAELMRKGILAILQAVREDEPVRPSIKLSSADALPSLSANRSTEPKKLTSLMRKELDWIVMKALEKNRGRRYETAIGLAKDVERYLQGEPVSAHPPTHTYRLKKFLQKNKGLVTAASLITTALIAGLVSTSLALNYATIETKRAERHANNATQLSQLSGKVSNAFLKIQYDLKNIPGSSEIRRQMVLSSFGQIQNIAKPYLSKADVDQNDVEALTYLGDIVLRFGEGTAESYETTSLRDDIQVANGSATKLARTLYSRAFEIAQKLADGAPSDQQAQINLSVACERFGNGLLKSGELDGAIQSFQRAIKIREIYSQTGTGTFEDQRDISILNVNLGDAMIQSGKPRDALNYFERAIEIRERLDLKTPDNQSMRDLGVAYERQGEALMALGEFPAASESYKKARKISQNLVKTNPDNSMFQMDLSVALEKYGNELREQGDSRNSIAQYQACLKIREQLVEEDPNARGPLQALGVAYDKVADVLRQAGESTESLESYKKAYRIRQNLALADPNDATLQTNLTFSLVRIGELQFELGNTEDAIKNFRSCLEIRKSLAAINSTDVKATGNLASAHVRIGNALLRIGKVIDAGDQYRSSLSLRKQLEASHPDDLQFKRDLAGSYHKIGDLESRLGNQTESLDAFRKCVEIRELLSSKSPGRNANRLLAVSYIGFSVSLVRNRRLDDATTQVLKAVDICRAQVTQDENDFQAKKDLAGAFETLGDVQMAEKKWDEAVASYQEMLKYNEQAVVDPNNLNGQRDLAISYTKLGGVFSQLGDNNEATRHFRLNFDICEKLVDADPNNTEAKRDLSVAHNRLGNHFLKNGKPDVALEQYEALLAINKKTAETDGLDARSQRDLMFGHFKVGEAMRALGRFEEAAAAYSRGADVSRLMIENKMDVRRSKGELIELTSKELYSQKMAKKMSKATGPWNELMTNPDDELCELLDLRGIHMAKAGENNMAIKSATKLISLETATEIQMYNSACVFSLVASSIKQQEKQELTVEERANLKNYVDRALEALRMAVAAGWTDAEQMATDPDLEILHESPEFKQILSDLKNNTGDGEPKK